MRAHIESAAGCSRGHPGSAGGVKSARPTPPLGHRKNSTPSPAAAATGGARGGRHSLAAPALATRGGCGTGGPPPPGAAASTRQSRIYARFPLSSTPPRPAPPAHTRSPTPTPPPTKPPFHRVTTRLAVPSRGGAQATGRRPAGEAQGRAANAGAASVCAGAHAHPRVRHRRPASVYPAHPPHSAHALLRGVWFFHSLGACRWGATTVGGTSSVHCAREGGGEAVRARCDGCSRRSG